MKSLRNNFLVRTAAVAVIGLTASVAVPASEYIVQALPMKWTPPEPGAAPIVMWGFRVRNEEPGSCPSVNAPLPDWAPLVLRHDQDAQIAIKLFNCLPVPTSMLVSGMADTRNNARFGTRTDASAPLTRLVSEEAGVRSGPTPTVVEYVFSTAAPGLDRRPGTYLIQSGSDPKRQVQMGLYGAIVTGYQGIPNARDRLVLFSELDPALHPVTSAASPNLASVTGAAGSVNLRNYAPRYFLINGQAFTAGTGPLVDVPTGNGTINNPNPGRVLLRLLNAGLQDRAPQLLGRDFTILTRDSRPVAPNLQFAQSTELLGAGVSLDVSVPRNTAGAIPLYDRRLGLVNGSASGGGMRAMICIGPTGDPRCP
ncbi:MAG: hypothetical protein IT482_07025 [Gammaproteobacteria bacterium]|nr:hypothetical protein [Gammaproteobacteria bacterium]